MRVKAPECDNPRCRSPMLRAYVRPSDDDHKQRLATIGWWCPSWSNFRHD